MEHASKIADPGHVPNDLADRALSGEHSRVMGRNIFENREGSIFCLNLFPGENNGLSCRIADLLFSKSGKSSDR